MHLVITQHGGAFVCRRVHGVQLTVGMRHHPSSSAGIDRRFGIPERHRTSRATDARGQKGAADDGRQRRSVITANAGDRIRTRDIQIGKPNVGQSG